MNPLYQNILIDPSWENVSQESDSELWNILTDENHRHVEGEIDDSDEDTEGNDHAYEKEVQDSVLPLPTVLHNIEDPSVSPAQVLNIAPGEGQIPVSFITELSLWKISFWQYCQRSAYNTISKYPSSFKMF